MILKYAKWIIVSVILLNIVLFLYNSDIQGIRANLSAVGLSFLYIILVTFVAQIFGTLSWRSTLPKSTSISFKDLFLIRYIGEHIGLINPANFVGGDAFKAYQLEKKGISYNIGISSLVVARMVMIYVQVIVYIVAAIWYLSYTVNEKSLLLQSIWVSIGFVAISAVIAVLSDKIFRFRIFKFEKLIENIRAIRTAIKYYLKHQRGRLVMSIFWAVVNFLIGALEIWLICLFIGVDISYLESLVIDQGALFFKSFAAFIPGQVGVEEYINKLMLGIIGVSSLSVWVSVSILRRARQLFWLLLGVLTYYVFMKSPKWTSMKIEKI